MPNILFMCLLCESDKKEIEQLKRNIAACGDNRTSYFRDYYLANREAKLTAAKERYAAKFGKARPALQRPRNDD